MGFLVLYYAPDGSAYIDFAGYEYLSTPSRRVAGRETGQFRPRTTCTVFAIMRYTICDHVTFDSRLKISSRQI